MELWSYGVMELSQMPGCRMVTMIIKPQNGTLLTNLV